jgi:hypothetical protein
MRSRTKFSILLVVFFGILLSYLLLITFFPSCWINHLCGLSQSMIVNCFFLIFSSLFVAWLFSEFIDFCYEKTLEIRWRGSKLGKIFVSEGYVTEEDLREALREQNLRVGEVLVRAGRITAEQLEHALNRQREVPGKLGDILKDLAYSTDEDIDWALDNTGKRLGEILVRNDVISRYDLNSSLALQRYGPGWLQKVWEGKISIH